MIAPAEVEREGRRILRRLMVGARLKRLDDGSYALASRTGRIEKGKARLAGEMVRAMASRGWLDGGEALFGLSEAGLYWYRRAMAQAEPFAAQHRAMTTKTVSDEHGIERPAAVNLMESPLAWMAGRGLIDKAQAQAGERLRRDYTLAQLTPRLGVDLSAPMVLGKRAAKDNPMSDMVLAAKQRFARAMAAAGPGLSDLLFDVCCDLKGLEACERACGWPRASAKVVLRIGLDRLALHYGLIVTPPAHARLRAWTKEGQ